MAVQSDTSRIQYAGNNSTTTSYAVPFVFQENSHLKAIARTSAGVESVVTLTNHTGAGDVNGGTVRTAVAVPATSTLTIYREVPATQTTTYAEGGDFPAASHERALDKLTQIAQQNQRQIGASLRLSESNQIAPLPLPIADGQHVLATAGSGTAPSFQSLGSLAIGPVIASGSTTPRSVQDRFADAINVKDFGAVGNGVTNDTAAIQSALNAIPSTGGAIFIPKGTYICSATLTASNKPIAIVGAGIGISNLQWSGPSTVGANGITYTNTDFQPFKLQDISLIAYADSSNITTLCGTGVSITYPSNETVFETTAKLIRVEIRGKRSSSGVDTDSGWATCLYAKDAGRLRLFDCNFVGRRALNNKGVHIATGLNAFKSIISQCEFTAFETAVLSEGPSSPGDTVVTDSNFTSCWRGINCDTPTDLLTCSSNYFQIYNYGISCKARTVFITGNRIDGVNDPRTLHSPADLFCIKINGTGSGPYDGGIIANNQLARSSTEPCDGIILQDAVQQTCVTGNTIGTATAYGTALRDGIKITGGATRNYISDNVMVAATCLVKDTSSGTGFNVVRNNMVTTGGGMMPVTGTSITLTSGQFNRTLHNVVYLTQTGATNVTGLTNGYDGQVVTIVAGDNNSTIKHSGTLILSGGSDFAMGGNDTLTLLFDGIGWREIARTI